MDESTCLGVLALLVFLAAYKTLPWMWHARFFRMIIARQYFAPTPSTSLTIDCLFLPVISSNRSPLSECDYNIHKSNSTYFTDVDISRANLCGVLFGRHVAAFPGLDSTKIVLGGVQCVFKREIQPGSETWPIAWRVIYGH